MLILVCNNPVFFQYTTKIKIHSSFFFLKFLKKKSWCVLRARKYGTQARYCVKHIQKLGAIKTKLYLIRCIVRSDYPNKDDRSRFKLQGLPGSAVFMNFINYYFPIPHVDRYFYKVAVAAIITIPQQQSAMLTVRYQYNNHCHRSTSFII